MVRKSFPDGHWNWGNGGYWGKFSGLENSNQEDQEMANGGLISGVTGTQESAEEGNGWQR